ncbi:MAG TPA: YggT family protein [Cellvibrio sp.]|nr:YggT family protein [Cellvibrio sp.]
MQTLAEIAVFIISSLGSVYLTFVVLRFLLQLFRADYYNPISKVVVKVTNPLLIPLRKVVPGFFGIDFAGIVLALLVQALILQVILFILGFGFLNPLTLLAWAFLGVLGLVFAIYYWGLLIVIIASWVAPYSSQPALSLLREIIEPVMAPFRKIIPPMGGLDLSPMVVIMVLHVLKNYLLPPLAQAFGMPAGLALGL